MSDTYQIEPSVTRIGAISCLSDPSRFERLVSAQIVDHCGHPKHCVDKAVARNGSWENRRTIIWFHTGRPGELGRPYTTMDHCQMDYFWEVGRATGWDVSVTGMMFVVSDLCPPGWTPHHCTLLADELEEQFQEWQTHELA